MFNRSSYLKQQKNLNFGMKKQNMHQMQSNSTSKTNANFTNRRSSVRLKNETQAKNTFQINPNLVKNSQKIETKIKVLKSKQSDSSYILKQLIGEGAFAKVRIGYRKTDDLKCVIKIFQKSKLIKQSRKKAIEKQIQILKQINHPSIIKIIDNYETNDSICIVMEYFSSVSLGQHCRSIRPICQNKIRQITRQIAQALTYLHQKKVAHRDLKSQNILINQKNQIKIIDLGLAMIGDHDFVMIAGTPQYMCPQLIHKKNYDPYKADIWSFGIMLYWIVLGYYPQDNNQKTNRKSLTTRKDVILFDLKFPSQMHPGIQYLISKMLETDPMKRIQANQILTNSWLTPRNLQLQISKLIKSVSQI